ncbi:MAG: endonuclease III [Kiritimatiellaeota bacterium]|nr:endonuclease III [Kiritimatiellota bacterium]
MLPSDIPAVNRHLKKAFHSVRAPIMELVAAQTQDPFRILLGTILSARTKDACTAAACGRLFEKVTTPDGLRGIPLEELERLIYPVGFYREKARHLKALPGVLDEKFGGVLPQTIEGLCELPGVGRKTANLVVALGFDKPAICVDVHVHRITNRLGLVCTKTPYETEMALRGTLPVRYWKTWNSYLVSFGQTRCAPRNPRCAGCPIAAFCNIVSDLP